jgi:hypothetical protein
MKKTIFIFLAWALSNSLLANDTIRFTWQADTSQKNIKVWASADKVFTINWGDSNIDTCIGVGFDMPNVHTYNEAGIYDVTIAATTEDCRFIMLYCSQSQILNLDVSNCTALQQLFCSYNQLINLDISNNTELFYFACPNNQLSSLDVSNNTSLGVFYCMNNRLPLSDLFTASEIINNQNNCNLGTQTLASEIVVIGNELFGEQAVFNGIYTDFTVTQNDTPVPENDYTITNGKLIFHTLGTYTATMANEAIVSHDNYPAKVTIELTVIEDTGIPESTLPNINIYPNPTTGELKIESGELRIEAIEIFDISGRTQKAECKNQKGKILMDISELPAGVYFLRIKTEQGEVVKKVMKE